MSADSSDHSVKLKVSEKEYKYLNLAKELIKLWNMKVTVILNVIGALSTLFVPRPITEQSTRLFFKWVRTLGCSTHASVKIPK